MTAFEEAAELFERLVELPVGERGPELERCAPGGEVRELVRRMLAGAERPLTGLIGPGAPAASADAAASPPSFVPEGRRYRVLGELARGGMGVVLRGRDEELGREVAIKVLRRDRGGAARARFVEEAQVAGQLQHPGVVPVYEMGRDAEGRPFFAMKLIEGQTLATRLAARAARAAPGAAPGAERARFLGIFLQVCQTLAYAHARGVIHRDLKPSNVMVGSFGEVQVLDWGLAKVLGASNGSADHGAPAPVETVRTRDSSGSASLSGSVMGTPGYMPPEQARGEVERLDRRADVFSLGAILCEILTGAPPFAGDRDAALGRARAGDLEPARARLAACGADPGLVALARRALAPRPEDRPADAGALVDALQEHEAQREERLRASELAAEAARVRALEERRARRLTAGLALTGMALFLSVAGALWWRAHERGQRVAALSHDASVALEAAAARLGTARAAPLGQEAPWEAAGLALEAVQGLLDSGATEAGVRARHADLAAAFAAERAVHARASAVFRRDRELVQRLEEIRSPRGDGLDPFDYARMEAGYRAAFGEYGIDPARPAEARAVLARSAVARELGLALDQWALCHRVLSKGAASAREAFSDVLLELAEQGDPDPLRSRIRRAVRGDDLDELRAVAGGELDGLAPESLYALAVGLRRLEDLEAAIGVLQRGVRARRGDYWLQLSLAIFLRARDGNASRAAVPYFHAALALRPNSLEARHLLGQNLAGLGDLDEALRLAEELVALEPENGHWRAHQGEHLLDLGDLEGALSALEEAVRLAPDDGFALNQLGHAYLAAGRPWRALAPFARDFELEPDAESGLNLAAVHLRLGDNDRAWPLLLEYSAQGSDPPLRFYTLANAADDHGQPELAEDSFRRAIALGPTFAQPHCNLARLLRDQGRFEESLEEYRRCQELGRRQSGFDDPVHEWAATVERARIYADELEFYREDGLDVSATQEALEIAYAALWTGWNRAAAGWFAEIVATLPPTTPDYQNHTHYGALAAARAAAGVGHDAPAPGSEESLRLAAEAVRLMHLSLARLMEAFESDPPGELEGTRDWIQSWRTSPGLAVLREDGAAGFLPGVRSACRALWDDVERALARLDAIQATLE